MTWTIVTPDGVTYNLPAVAMDEVTGLGMPPLEHLSHIVPQQDGAKLDAIYARQRIVTMRLGFSDTDSMADMHALVSAFDDAIRYDRMGDAQPFELQYTENGKTRVLYAYILDYTDGYAGYCAEIAVRFICYDPFVYDDAGITEYMSGISRLTLNYVAGRVNGTWDDLESPSGGAVTGVYAIAEDDTYVYFGGNFTNFDGIAAADYIVRYEKSTGTYSAMGTGANDVVNGICVSFGKVYVVGNFTSVGGVVCNRVAVWDGSAWAAVGTGFNDYVVCIAAGPDGTIYAGGDFTTADGNPADRIAAWNGTAWTEFSGGLDSVVYDIDVSNTGVVWAAGNFTQKIASSAGSSWTDYGSAFNSFAYAVCVGPDGTIYAGGGFTTYAALTVNRIAAYKGNQWVSMNGGANNDVRDIEVDTFGNVYASGLFTQIGGITTSDGIAQWNGYVWSALDVELPGTPIIYDILIDQDNDIYLGFNTAGTTTASGSSATIQNSGTAKTFPIISIYGPGTLEYISNRTTDKSLYFDMTMIKGDIVTIDLSENAKTIESSTGASRLADLYPQSDLATWALAPDAEATSGNNVVSVYITGQPLEYNDGSNQLTYYELVTGLTTANTNAGRLYFSIIADGGGFYHVNIYRDAARTLLVAHTATYNGTGSKALVADNASGIGGSIYVSAVVAADADIYVDYALVVFEYTNRYWTMHQAIG